MKIASIHAKIASRANIDTNKSNGTQPNQNFEMFFTKLRVPTHFQKNPQILESELKFLHNLRKT